MSPNVQPQKNLVSMQVDEKIFPRSVVVAAAYVFLDRCYVHLERAPRKHVEVQLKGKKKLAKTRLTGLAEEFENELLHQLIRHQVAEKTDQLREVIVGRALLSAEPDAFGQPGLPGEVEEGDASAAGEPGEELDYLDDPLGIAVPWEEKYGDEKEED